MRHQPEITSENLSAAPGENGTGARLINHTLQAGTGTGRRSDLEQSSLPFPEPATRRGVCRQCGGPTKFIGKIKGGSIRRCDHCGARQGELSACRSVQTRLDFQKPQSETDGLGGPSASSSRLFVATGDVVATHEDGVRTSHERD